MLPNTQWLTDLPRGSTFYSVTTFADDNLKGNQHIVIPIPQLHEAERLALLKIIQDKSRQVPSRILVVIFLEASLSKANFKSSPAISVRFYQCGHAIKRCGSGTLAAAKILFDCCIFEDQIVPSNKEISLISESQLLNVKKLAADVFCYRTSVFAAQPVKRELIPFWRKLIGVDKLNAIYYLGGQNDYCLMVLPLTKTLALIRPNFVKIKQFTSRALIITAPTQLPAFDYALRYFAPQYGNNEDIATGSAHAQAAFYWQDYFHKKRVVGVQLSDNGGKFCTLNSDKFNGHKWQTVIGKVSCQPLSLPTTINPH